MFLDRWRKQKLTAAPTTNKTKRSLAEQTILSRFDMLYRRYGAENARAIMIAIEIRELHVTASVTRNLIENFIKNDFEGFRKESRLKNNEYLG
jgi:hypothetical protein